MIDRFRGEGVAQLREALLRQRAVEHSPDVVEKIIKAATLNEYKKGEDVIVQAASDSDVHFIIAGSVDILVHGTWVGSRGANAHVGEMAFIDPSQPRSATVRASETVVTASVSASTLLQIADEHPRVWRALASELAHRLRARSSLVREKNAKPIVFVGCSAERLKIARALQDLAVHENFIVQIWTDDVFQPSHQTLEDLIPMVQKSDFGVLLMFPDDITHVRKEDHPTPRDNVVLELGMLLAVLDRERTLFVQPLKRTVKMPSDMLGLKPVDFQDDPDDSTLAARLGPVANALRKKVASLGAR